VKLGELYRRGGVDNGRHILDESFVSEATRAQSGDLPGFGLLSDDDVIGGNVGLRSEWAHFLPFL
jgi:hypothetical protein